MKTILFILPIGIITNTFFTIRYGEYHIDKTEYVIQYALKEQTWFTIGLFCILCIFSYYMQTLIIPFSMIKIGKYRTEYDKFKITEIIKSKISLKFFKKIKKKKIIKIYTFYSEISVFIILWLLCLKNYFVLIPIVLICIFLVFIAKALNTIFEKKP